MTDSEATFAGPVSYASPMGDSPIEEADAAEETSGLVKHAIRELTAIGEDPKYIEQMVKVVRAFSEMGHSGTSAYFCIGQLEQLLLFKNLGALTNDPSEWHFHEGDVWGEQGEDGKTIGIYQNRRNGEAFSYDGGKTYYLLSDGSNSKEQRKWYTAEDAK